MAEGHANVEVKADCSDHDRIRRVLREHDARAVRSGHQTDTYFDVPEGTLKLREGNEQYLVQYDRTDTPVFRYSDVTLYETVGDVASLKGVLADALGIDVVVEKTRATYVVGEATVHLDEVARLGQFVEVEVVDDGGDAAVEELESTCRRYVDLLGIDRDDVVSESYGDLASRGEVDVR